MLDGLGAATGIPPSCSPPAAGRSGGLPPDRAHRFRILAGARHRRPLPPRGCALVATIRRRRTLAGAAWPCSGRACSPRHGRPHPSHRCGQPRLPQHPLLAHRHGGRGRCRGVPGRLLRRALTLLGPPASGRSRVPANRCPCSGEPRALDVRRRTADRRRHRRRDHGVDGAEHPVRARGAERRPLRGVHRRRGPGGGAGRGSCWMSPASFRPATSRGSSGAPPTRCTPRAAHQIAAEPGCPGRIERTGGGAVPTVVVTIGPDGRASAVWGRVTTPTPRRGRWRRLSRRRSGSPHRAR